MIPATLRENRARLLAEVLGAVPDGASLRRWRDVTLRTGARLQAELGTREPPVQLVDGPDGPALRAAGIAGTFRMGGVEWTVIPKFVSDDARGDWEATLLTLVRRAGRRSYTPTRRSGLGSGRLVFVDHVALAFADALEHALASAPISTYRSDEVEAPALVGRLHLTRQLGHVFTRPHVYSCEVDRLDTDNPFNHLLHWATARFTSLVRSGAVRLRLRLLGERLPAVRPPARLPARLPLRLPPQFPHYVDAIQLATLLALGRGLVPGGHGEGYGLVIDLAPLWEGFVHAALRDACARLPDGPWEVWPQHSQRFAEALTDDTRSYWTRPDDVVVRGGSPVVLVDAKYKVLADAETGSSKRPINGDVYQLACSLVAHGCTRGLLVYPKVMGEVDLGDGRIRQWRVTLGDRALLLGAVALDLRELSSTSALVRFDECLGGHILALAQTPA
jgi:5-methylcytosine-specific restriction enzyme subunit McrC